MAFSQSLIEAHQNLLRERARIEEQIEAELDQQIVEYRSRYALRVQRGERPLAILSEGDSWFQYRPAGKDVIDYLERMLEVDINNLAKPGDEAREILTGEQKARLTRELSQGPMDGHKYDYLLFSGGGNDLVGSDRFGDWLRDYEEGMSPADVIVRDKMELALGWLKVAYDALVAIRDAESSQTILVFHGYDFAIPNGKGVCFQGPWLRPGLVAHGVPEQIRAAVVREFLLVFQAFLEQYASEDVIVAPTQSTLGSLDWANELHPTDDGFERIARVLAAVLS